MAQFHFVEDYEKLVDNLLATHPIDEAMSLVVGGGYDNIGKIELEILNYAGLRDGMTLLDMGCGSGRLAVAASSRMQIDYIGIDVVQRLLDYAKSRSPSHYRFIKSHSLTIPLPDQSVDMICAFSLFTHLLHHETYLYLEEFRRILKPGGKVVFSFLEFAMASHWDVFAQTVEAQRSSILPTLNQFIERAAIETWCNRLSMHFREYVRGDQNPWELQPALGQSLAFLVSS